MREYVGCYLRVIYYMYQLWRGLHWFINSMMKLVILATKNVDKYVKSYLHCASAKVGYGMGVRFLHTIQRNSIWCYAYWSIGAFFRSIRTNICSFGGFLTAKPTQVLKTREAVTKPRARLANENEQTVTREIAGKQRWVPKQTPGRMKGEGRKDKVSDLGETFWYPEAAGWRACSAFKSEER